MTYPKKTCQDFTLQGIRKHPHETLLEKRVRMGEDLKKKNSYPKVEREVGVIIPRTMGGSRQTPLPYSFLLQCARFLVKKFHAKITLV
jgi:hypothetical protein